MLEHVCAACSLDHNALCGINHLGGGTYTTEGITKIVDMLKANTTLTSIRCLPSHLPFGMLAPADMVWSFAAIFAAC